MSKARQNYMHQCDVLFSKLIRARGECELASPSCRGPLQCAHGFSRRYSAVRCDPRNAFALCQGHHFFYTHRPLEWVEWLRERWGDELYAELRTAALSQVKVDWKALSAELRQRVSEAVG